MKVCSFRVVFVLMAVIFLTLSPQAWAEEEREGLSDATKGGIGCLAAVGGTLAASLLAGPSELVMVAAGGTLSPSATTPLLVSLTATLFVATCSMGIAATPAVLWFSEQVGVVFDGLRGRGASTIDTHRRPEPTLAVTGKQSDGIGAGTLVVQSSH
ncbi:membrane hypothetical protein [Gammaproteobacteria bacterium]